MEITKHSYMNDSIYNRSQNVRVLSYFIKCSRSQWMWFRNKYIVLSPANKCEISNSCKHIWIKNVNINLKVKISPWILSVSKQVHQNCIKFMLLLLELLIVEDLKVFAYGYPEFLTFLHGSGIVIFHNQ